MTKVNLITEEGLFASVSYVTGEGLTQKIGTLYGLVTVVLDSNGDTNGEDETLIKNYVVWSSREVVCLDIS
jgi:hypothetical protein